MESSFLEAIEPLDEIGNESVVRPAFVVSADYQPREVGGKGRPVAAPIDEIVANQHILAAKIVSDVSGCVAGSLLLPFT